MTQRRTEGETQASIPIPHRFTGHTDFDLLLDPDIVRPAGIGAQLVANGADEESSLEERIAELVAEIDDETAQQNWHKRRRAAVRKKKLELVAELEGKGLSVGEIRNDGGYQNLNDLEHDLFLIGIIEEVRISKKEETRKRAEAAASEAAGKKPTRDQAMNMGAAEYDIINLLTEYQNGAVWEYLNEFPH
jgi:hypothetical protein